MGRVKNFVIPVFPRDLLLDLKGLSDRAATVYVKFWMNHHLHGQPLPPREEQVADQDEWFREVLDLKNVRGWRAARDELLQKARIRKSTDGRYYIGRTMRDLGVEVAEAAPELPLEVLAAPVGNPVDSLCDTAGEAATSGEVPSNFGRSSGEVRANIDRTSPEVGAQVIDLKSKSVRPSESYSESKSKSHDVAVTSHGPRARDGPAGSA